MSDNVGRWSARLAQPCKYLKVNRFIMGARPILHEYYSKRYGLYDMYKLLKGNAE